MLLNSKSVAFFLTTVMPLVSWAGNDKASEAAFKLFAGFLVTGIALLIHGLLDFKKARRIQDTARVKIGSAPQGYVELEGYAWPLHTPIRATCGRQVVYYNYKVMQEVRRGKETRWETKYEFNYQKPFFVLDSTGACIVNPPTAIRAGDIASKTTKIYAYVTEVEFLKKAMIKPSGLFTNMFAPNYALVEKKIFVGSPIYVSGSMQSSPNSERDIRGDFKTFLQTAETTKKNPFLRDKKFDLNGDGVISEDEMRLGMSDIYKSVASTSAKNTIRITGDVTHTPEHPLILADCTEDQLLKRLTRSNSAQIIFGILLIGAAFAALARALK